MIQVQVLVGPSIVAAESRRSVAAGAHFASPHRPPAAAAPRTERGPAAPAPEDLRGGCTYCTPYNNKKVDLA